MEKKETCAKTSFETHEDVEICWDKVLTAKGNWATRSVGYYLNWHDSFEIRRIYSGEGVVWCGTKPVRVRGGDVVIHNPFELHECRALSEQLRYDLIIVSPNVVFDGRLWGNTDPHTGTRIRFENLIRDDPEACSYVAAFLEACRNKDSAWEMMAEGRLLALFAYLTRQYKRESLPESEYDALPANLHRIEPALQYMVSSYDREITIKELASMCHVTQYHFCRLFQYLTGTSAIQFLIRRRLDRAYYLLKFSDISIAEIARQVGYPDPGYFNRLFRQRYGKPPGTVRKEDAYFPEIG